MKYIVKNESGKLMSMAIPSTGTVTLAIPGIEILGLHSDLNPEDNDIDTLSWQEVELEPAVEATEGQEARDAVFGMRLVEDQDKINAKQQASIDAAIAAALDSAMAFGSKLMKEFTQENMKMGITQDGMTGTVRKAMTEVILALTTGSLYDAIDEAKAIPAEKKDPKYITDARLLSFINKIETYLGQPLTETL